MHVVIPTLARDEVSSAYSTPARLSPDLSSRRVLNSWKEIAIYVNRGVRTLQRWERELGFPVRRPRGKSRSAVIAFTDEIDNWLRAASCGTSRRGRSQEAINELHRRHNELTAATLKLVQHAHQVYTNVEVALERYRASSAGRQRRLPVKLC
jgi:hypothetical protein